MDDYRGKNVLVLGLGLSGRSAVQFLLDRGAEVVGVDHNPAALFEEPNLRTCLDSDAIDLAQFDFVVTSPGVSPMHSLLMGARKNGIEVIGEVELACRHLSQPFLGITGTNGKTTVSLLVGHVLNQTGHKARVLGNVGTPITSQQFFDPQEIIVCELSSYQLETLRSPVIDYGVILNITPDHLDRYQFFPLGQGAKSGRAPNTSSRFEDDGFEHYAATKIGIARCVRGKLFVGKKVWETFSHLFSKKEKEKLEIINLDPYRSYSNHDDENIMAAFALCSQIGVHKADFDQALETFSKPPHRVEFVRTIDGVNFYNDSKGTNLDAVMRAVESVPGKVILIAGGQAKGVRFTPWLQAFGDKVKTLCVIGEAKDKLRDELSGKYAVETCETLKNAIDCAFTIAKEGENVLLSPGCASFDMFKNYAQRGDRFKEIVHALEGKKT